MPDRLTHGTPSATNVVGMRVRGLCGVLGVLAVGLLASAPNAGAAAVPIFEEYSVPSVDGATINVEVMRPAGVPNAPVILTYSPYNTLSETTAPNLANDDLGQQFLELGYARAVADVLGTRDSSGCWDYGGPRETQSGVDLVNFLATQSWSNGSVGMIGGSYDGTTANMVASRGDDAPGLKAIVPIAAIGRWYGYAYGDGVRYAGNSEVPTDEGADTPLAFDFGLTRTPPTDPTDPAFLATFLSRINPCDSVAHTQAGYDDTPDYNQFWIERDYRRHADQFRAAALVVHGWQDYNVKQEEGVRLFEALPTDDPATAAVEGVPFKLLYMFQGPHGSPGDANWEPLLERFFAQTLLGVPSGVETGPVVLSEPRSADSERLDFTSAAAWPPPTTGPVELSLGRADGAGTLASAGGGPPASYTDAPAATEEASLEDPDTEGNWLFYASGELSESVRLAGEAKLDLRLEVNRDHAHLTPVLVDIAPDGTARTVSRGFLNLLYRNGLEATKPVAGGRAVRGQGLLQAAGSGL